jgi:hypothetical protein
MELIQYQKMDWRVVKWSIINTFELGHVDVDNDQWDDFGSFE